MHFIFFVLLLLVHFKIALLSATSEYENEFIFRGREKVDYKAFGCKNICSPSPCPCTCGGLKFDFLYWRATEDGISCAADPLIICDHETEDGLILSEVKGKFDDLKYQWDPGIRVAFFHKPSINSEIEISWIHFQSGGLQKENNGKINWKIHLNYIDLLFKYHFEYCSFIFSPYIGLRALETQQKINAQSTTIVNRTSFDECPPIISTSYAHKHFKEHVLELGPFLGINFNWMFGYEISLYGECALGVLYGRTKADLDKTDLFENGSSLTDKERTFKNCQAMLDASLGIQTKRKFCNCTTLIFQLGWEHHRFFSHNKMTGCGDLCLDGAVFSIGIEF